MTQAQNNSMQVTWMDPRSLRPHPDNPRIEINENEPEFMAFVDNLRANGILQPILATEGDIPYILAGHRRTRGAIAAAMEQVPVILKTMGAGMYAEDFFLSENGQRNDLSPLEEARAIKRIRERLTSEKGGAEPNRRDLSRRLNLPISQINQAFAILAMPERIQMLFHTQDLPLSAATHLQKLLAYPDELETMANRLLTRQVTTVSLSTLISRRLDDLAKTADERKTSHFKKGSFSHVSEIAGATAITRAGAVKALEDSRNNQISLFQIGVLVENICCQCGMMGTESVCNTCPLPKLLNGIAGRSNPR